MRRLIKLVCCLVIVFGLAQYGVSQNAIDAELQVRKLADVYSRGVISSLGRQSKRTKENLTFKESARNYFFSDLDKDGDFDSIVEVFFCEKTSCHPTTNWSELIVFIYDSQKYSFGASKGYQIFGKLSSIRRGRISVDIYGFEDDTPQCCPTILRNEVLTLTKGKLVASKSQE